MFDNCKFKVYAMVMPDGSVRRDVDNVKLQLTYDANFLVIVDKHSDEVNLQVWKDRFGITVPGPISKEDAEAAIESAVKETLDR